MALVLLIPREALATAAVLELDAEPGDAPTTMCIVNRRAERTTFVNVSTVIGLGTMDEKANLLRFGKPSSESDKEKLEKNFSALAKGQNSENRLVEAVRGLQVNPSSSSYCDPVIHLDPNALASREVGKGEAEKKKSRDQLGVMCIDNRANKADTPAASRVLVVFMDFHSFTGEDATPLLKKPYFDGNVASLELDVPANQRADFFSVRVLGGHYIETERNAVSQGRPDGLSSLVRVPVTTRCRQRTVRLPASWSGPTSFAATAGQKLLACTTTDVQPNADVKIVVPNGLAGELKVLGARTASSEAKDATPDSCRAAVAKPHELDKVPIRSASAQWSEERALPVIELKRTETSFTWVTDPIYAPPRANAAQEECPRAELSQAGVVCAPVAKEAGRLCKYVCAHPSRAVQFQLPTVVRFRKRDYDSDVWSEVLVHDDQPLSGYLPSGERYIQLIVPWGDDRASRDADHITAIDVTVGGGQPYLIPPGDTRLPAAGLRPGSALTYQLHGDRWYSQHRVVIDSERMEIPEPEHTLKTVMAHISVGGGFAWAADSRGPRFEDLSGWSYGGGTLGASYRPAGWRLAFDLSGGYMLSERDYFVLGRSAASRRAPEQVAYARIPMQLGVSVYASSRWAFGAGLGPMIGHGLGSEAAERVGSLNVSLAAYLSARARLYRSLWLAYEPRAHFGEPIYSHALDDDGTPLPMKGSVTSLLLFALSLRAELGVF
ncbi:MAG: hypothetical protein KF819_23860 [Labilithrix sp.]|nr:hypothetical protein [Labilithrix sp.]